MTRAAQFHAGPGAAGPELPGRSGFASAKSSGGRAGGVSHSHRTGTEGRQGARARSARRTTSPSPVRRRRAARAHQAVIRRTRSDVDQLTPGDRVSRLRSIHATNGREPLHLTRREFDLRHYLAERSDRVVYRDELLREIWGYPENAETRVRLTTRRATPKKIEEDPRHPRFMLTVTATAISSGSPPPPDRNSRTRARTCRKLSRLRTARLRRPIG